MYRRVYLSEKPVNGSLCPTSTEATIINQKL
nr:MAG TPA: hypothetical protein [Caudoviricetes sp.]